MVGQADAQLVFVYMIANCDADGFIDQTQEVIAALTGVPLGRVRVAIEMLCAPDSRSRSTEEQGRRLVPMDDSRDWGWQIVNYAKYRAMRDEEVRRAQNRDAAARRRERLVNSTMTRQRESASVSRGQPMQKKKQKQRKKEEESKDDCPARFASPGPTTDSQPVLGVELAGTVPESLEGARAARPRRGVAAGAESVDPRETTGAAVEEIPLAGGEGWVPSVAEFEEWVRLFPGVDVRAEFRRMRAWSLSARKRKTLRGVRAFVRNWLDAEQNRGGGRETMRSREARDYTEANKP